MDNRIIEGVTLMERVVNLRAWATNRIRACREQETTFPYDSEPREGTATSALADEAHFRAITERSTLEAVLNILDDVAVSL